MGQQIKTLKSAFITIRLTSSSEMPEYPFIPPFQYRITARPPHLQWCSGSARTQTSSTPGQIPGFQRVRYNQYKPYVFLFRDPYTVFSAIARETCFYGPDVELRCLLEAPSRCFTVSAYSGTPGMYHDQCLLQSPTACRPVTSLLTHFKSGFLEYWQFRENDLKRGGALGCGRLP
ncbi:hypothetical protein L218DRAFT_560736 [Marasmius fiardii PR-910]|nr:hypothetical protein L218DRAFT_560736 [Marasmius fiardii PR-910]